MLLVPLSATSQEQIDPPPSEAPEYNFWSGTVAEVEDGWLTVRRVLIGRKPELKRFVLNNDTIIEGELRANARVTVAFIESDEGDLAKRILVRTHQ